MAKRYLTEEKFDDFIGNDIEHINEKLDKNVTEIEKVKKCLNNLHRQVSFMKGQLYVMLPLVVAILGLIIYMIAR